MLYDAVFTFAAVYDILKYDPSNEDKLAVDGRMACYNATRTVWSLQSKCVKCLRKQNMHFETRPYCFETISYDL